MTGNTRKGGGQVTWRTGGDIHRAPAPWRRAVAGLLAAVFLIASTGCATTSYYRKGEDALRSEDYDRAVLLFTRALATKPDNIRYKTALARARIQAADVHFRKGQAYAAAKRWDAAIAEYQQVAYLAPAHQYAAAELIKAIEAYQKLQAGQESDMDRMKRKAKESPGRVPPRLSASSNIPIVLRFKDETARKIYDALSKASGVNFIYDERLDLNKKISIDLAEVTFEQALNTLMTMNKHFYKIWDDNAILIADDNQQKHKEYDDLVIQTFYLSNADVKDVQVLLRTLLDARQLAQNDRLNAITIRDTPERVAVAQKIIEVNDKAKSELIIDVELLEVDRSLLRSLGIDLFGPGGGSGKSIGISYGGGNSIPLNNLDLLKQAGSYLIGPIPGVMINFLKTDTDAQVLAKPQVRVSEGEKAMVRIGDRIPIPTTTFNAAPTVGGTVGVPITSFTYQNVGINLDLEPRVHHNKEVTLKLKVEVSSVAGTVQAGGGLTQPIIGTREIDTTIRLKDGETNLLAGLIREEERKSLSGVAGLSDIPMLKRLFGTTTTEVTTTDIVLTLTPHIIRTPDVTVEDLLPLWVGTEQNIALRGASRQSAFGLSPFEGDGEEPSTLPPVPDLPEIPVEEAAPKEDAFPDAAGAVLVPAAEPSPEPSPSPTPPAPSPTPTPPPPGPAPSPSPTPSPSPEPSPTPGPAQVVLVPSRAAINRSEEFTVGVMISQASNVGSVPLRVAFDPALVEFVDSTQTSEFLGQDGTPVFVLTTVSPGGSEVVVGLSRQGTRPGVNGGGRLIDLRFRAKATAGTLTLTLTDLSVLDPKAQRMEVSQQGTSVQIR